ncbi:MAG: OmpA family protein [Candidatus Latescibacterota bacterium]
MPGRLPAGVFLLTAGLAWAAAGQQGRPAAPQAPPPAREPSRYRVIRVALPPGAGGPQAGVSRARIVASFGSREGIQRGSIFTAYHGDVRAATVRVDEVWRDTSRVSLLSLSGKPSAASQYPLEVGDRLKPRYVLLESVEWGDGGSEITPQMQERLHAVARLILDFPDLPLVVEGHTDDAGKAADNQKLSEQRAALVRDFLQRTYLIPAERMHVRGYGESEPLAENSTAEGRRANRRVDIILADQLPPEPAPPSRPAGKGR